MVEPTTQAAPAKKAKPAAADMPKFEMPKFEMPSFDMPKIEVPAAFREIAEKGIAQCKRRPTCSKRLTPLPPRVRPATV
jgi:hypothetical protein